MTPILSDDHGPESETTRRFQGSFPAEPEQLARIRTTLREWLRRLAIPTDKQLDLLLVIGEATGNAAEHAYIGRDPGEVHIDIVEKHNEALVRVRDFGRWRAPSSPGEERARGTGIMKAISNHFTRDTGQHGTTVTMRVRMRDRVPSSRQSTPPSSPQSA